MPRLAPLAVLLCLACCGGDRERLTIYLPQRLGPEGPHGQRAPVLMPVERQRRGTMSAVRQAVLELMVGPAPAERARGFSDTLPPGSRADRVRVVGGIAEIDLAGPEPTFVGAAAIVYSATSVPGVRAARLLRYGKPCCVYLRSGPAVAEPHARTSFRGWSGEPCELRTYAHAVRCRGAG
ncbi:MAG: GerMN domain-containing protein [Thermoleophilia bacterium]|nr:GerMN domain-containing protein [Thermoleophilia bacterium]